VSSKPPKVSPSYSGLLEELMIAGKCRKIYFIDDAHDKSDAKDLFIGSVVQLINDGRLDEVRNINLDGLNLKVEESVLLDTINESWGKISGEIQDKYLFAITDLTGDKTALQDLDISEQLFELSDGGRLIEFMDPNKWKEENEIIYKALKDDEKIVLLMDQNLHQSGGEYGTKKGMNLLEEAKRNGHLKKSFLTLFTYTFSETSRELKERTDLIKEYSDLNIADFFVLTKARKNDKALLIDGIKKAMLNGYFEKIKTATNEILKATYPDLETDIDLLETYDFDDTVLKSSYAEGIWEGNTIFRLANIFMENRVKKLMIDKHYLTTVNSHIRNAKKISDVKITINPKYQPYLDKYKIRFSELYDTSQTLNELSLPIDNGDIFEIELKDRKSEFIIIGQECDLMMRSKIKEEMEIGERKASIAFLFEIIEKKSEKEFDKIKRSQNFLSNQCALKYYDNGDNNYALVDLTKPLLIDLDIIDLIVFNHEGKAEINLKGTQFDPIRYSFSWEKRFQLLKEKWEIEANELDKLYSEMEGVKDDLKTEIINKIVSTIVLPSSRGVKVNYSERYFRFGIKRVRRLKSFAAKYMLDQYTAYLSRFADMHDFAK
jgi:hypothetical protein